MKTQKVSFQSFMTGSYKKNGNDNINLFRDKNKLYSFISPTVFFDGGTLLFLGAGIVAVGLAMYENRAVKNGDMVKADGISLFGNVLLQGAGIVFALYLLSNMPFLHWL